MKTGWRLALGNMAFMTGQSQNIGVAYVVSNDSVLPDPPVRRPPNSPMREMIIDPESPPLENAPDLLSYGRIAHSIESL